MRKSLAVSTALVLAAAVAGPASAGLLGNAIGNAINGHGNGPVYFERKEALKGVGEAVLGQFSVVFLTKKVDHVGGGFLGGLDDKAETTGVLTGPSSDDYIRITDAVYADFRAKLERSGVKLRDPAAYYAGKYYAKVHDEEQGHKVSVPIAGGKGNADGLAFWPSAAPHRENVALTLRIMDTNTVNAYTAQYDYARTSKVPVLNVVLVIDFAGKSSTSGQGIVQTVRATSQLAVAAPGSLLYLMDTTGKPAKIGLNQPIVESGDFAQISDATSGATKAFETANMIGNMFKHGLMARNKDGISRKFDYHVTDTANYSALVGHASGLAADLLLQQFAAAR